MFTSIEFLDELKQLGITGNIEENGKQELFLIIAPTQAVEAFSSYHLGHSLTRVNYISITDLSLFKFIIIY